MEKTALPKLLKKKYTVDPNHEDIQRLYNLVSLRDLIGVYIWLILSGLLVVTTQTNALFSIDCKDDNSKIQTELQKKWNALENKVAGGVNALEKKAKGAVKGVEGEFKKVFYTRE